MIPPFWNFKEEPYPDPADETAINFRAYLDRMPDEKIREYSPAWSDDRVVEWDGNFREDGALMLVCCERDVDVKEYRRGAGEGVRERGRGGRDATTARASPFQVLPHP